MTTRTAKILRIICIVGIFLIPFVPLFVDYSMFFPFITARNMFFRVLVEIIGAAFIILAVIEPRYRPNFRNKFFVALVAFLVLIGIADIFGMNPYKSFWSNFERMEGWITMLHLAVYAVVAAAIMAEEKLWKYLFNTTILVSVIVSVIGLLQLAGAVKINQSGTRLDANFGNSTYLAIYMLFHVFLCLFMIVRFSREAWQKWVYGVVAFLDAVILYYTATRGAILGLLAGLFLTALLIALFEKNNARLRKISWGVIIAVLVLIGGFILIRKASFVQHSDVLSRLASISLSDPTTESRFIIWDMAWKGFIQSPKTVVLGWGQENFNYVFNKYYDPRMFNQEQWFDRTHNVILDWLIAGGILGLLSYLSLFTAVVWYLWKSSEFSRIEKSILTGMLGGYFVHNLFVFDNITSYILFFTFIAYIYSKTKPIQGASAPVQLPVSAETSARTLALVSVPVVLVLAFVLYYVNIIPYLQNVDLIQAIYPQQAGAEVNLSYFNTVFGYNAFGDYEAREQLLSTAEEVDTAAGAPDSIKQQFNDLSDTQMKIQLTETPEDARYYLFYGSFLDEIGEATTALPYLQKAVSLSPEKQTILFELGSAYLATGQYTQALSILKGAYDLDHDDQDALIDYAVAAVYANQLDLATQLTSSIQVSSTTPEDDRLLSIFAATKQYDKVLAEWQAKANANPNDPQTLVSLAAAYLAVNDRTDAIAEIQQAITVSPDFKTQGDEYIAEIKAGKNPGAQ